MSNNFLKKVVISWLKNQATVQSFHWTPILTSTIVVFEQFCLRLKLTIVTTEAIFVFAWTDLCDMQFAQISPHVGSNIKSLVDETAERWGPLIDGTIYSERSTPLVNI